MLLNWTNSYIFEPYITQLNINSNIHEIFQNIYHVDLLYILRCGAESFFVHFTPDWFFRWHLVRFFLIITDIW